VRGVVESLWPAHRWEAHKFAHTDSDGALPKLRHIIDSIAKRRNLQVPPVESEAEKWYSLKRSDFAAEEGGEALLRRHYGGLVASAVISAFPDLSHKWEIWKFEKVPPNFWSGLDKSSHRLFFQSLARHLNYDPDDLDKWYSIPRDKIIDFGGSRLLQNYNNSIFGALKSIFPEHHWMPWKFDTIPPHFWSDKGNCLDFMKYLEKKLNITSKEGWYEITRKHFVDEGGTQKKKTTL